MLEIRDLRVVYANGFAALRGATLMVQPGEIVALIGRSGAGKSTLMRCVNGLQPVTSGEVRVDGIDVARLNGRGLQTLRRRIGVIWQEYNVVERSTALTNVLAGRLGHRRGLRRIWPWFDRGEREMAVRSLERVHLLHRAHYRADRLSGGEKQRLAIARALTQEPALVLADEPVASLDATLSWMVMQDLVTVAREAGVATLVSLHDVPLARAFADRIVGIAGGVTVFDGRPDDLQAGDLERIYQAASAGQSAVLTTAGTVPGASGADWLAVSPVAASTAPDPGYGC
jgi:phosphonate transport system ATP-binding protein